MNDSTTIGEAKVTMMQEIDKGTHCPCCGRYNKVYRRRLNAGLALYLLRSAQRYNHEWFHVNNDVKNHKEFNGDYGKLEYWGLIEPMASTEAKSNAGYWRVTDRGHQFVRGEVTLPTFALVLNNKVLGFSPDQINISAALSGGGFDYQELMNAA